MQKIALSNSVFLALPIIFSSLAFAETSTPPAAPLQQGMGAGEHANHVDSAGAREAAGGGEGRPMAWTAFPMLKTRMKGEDRDRRVVTVVPQGIAANNIDAYSNDIEDPGMHRQLPLEMAGARLDKPESGGFHWLMAREEQAGNVRVASTVYFFSNPGQNPTALFMQQKNELEIVPQRYPREHSRYRANEEWKFLVRFNGNPLVNHKVLLETANGTKEELVSDALGGITVRIPDDFKTETRQTAAGGHDHGPRSSDFVLAIEHADGGISYLTAFNGSYAPGAFDQRSLAMGLGFTLLGMMGAVPLLRQRKNAKQAVEPKPAAANAANNKEA